MHYNPEKTLAAKKLDDNLKEYGTLINRQNLQSETAILDQYNKLIRNREPDEPKAPNAK